MMLIKQILLWACLGALLTACGQKGLLYLPTDPAAANRASLPDSLKPTLPAASAPTP